MEVEVVAMGAVIITVVVMDINHNSIKGTSLTAAAAAAAIELGVVGRCHRIFSFIVYY